MAKVLFKNYKVIFRLYEVMFQRYLCHMQNAEVVKKCWAPLNVIFTIIPPHLYAVYNMYDTGRTELLAKQFHTHPLLVLLSFHLLQNEP